MTKKNETLMQFPCHFPMKIIGLNSDTFVQEIITIVRQHFSNFEDKHLQTKPSQQGTYIAVSITVYVFDQNTLDRLYQALTQHPDIKMVL